MSVRGLLVKLRERIESEDYIGTCGCVSRRPKGKTWEEVCACLRDHNKLLAEIDAGIRLCDDAGESHEKD